MSYIVLARKYRPQTFEEIVGQGHITRTLKNSVSSGRVAHAILFSGPRGTGKTTAARILAKAMNCKDGPCPVPCNNCRSCKEITQGSAADVFEIDGASNNSVDQIRELRENVKYMPQHSRYKIYIIDEVHMLSLSAFNALLKTLEEPPLHVLFFFATTEPQKIPITILSRCQRHDFRRIGIESISNYMKLLCEKENTDVPEESLDVIARESEGCMRDALSLLDHVISCSDGALNHGRILDILSVIDREVIFDISIAIINKNIRKIFEIIDDIYIKGYDLKKFYSDLIEHVRNLIVVKTGKNPIKLVDVPAREIELMAEQARDISATYLGQILDILFREEAVIRFSERPRVAIELACFKTAQIKPALPIETLIEKFDNLKKGVEHNRKSGLEEPLSERSQSIEPPSKESQGNLKGDRPVNENRNSAGADKETEWKNLKNAVCKKYPSLATAMSKTRLNGLAEKEIAFEVTGTDFDFKMIDRKKDEIREICRAFLNRKVNLHIQANVIHKNEEDIKRPGRLKNEALNHPLVSDAVEIFNGKVIDVKLL